MAQKKYDDLSKEDLVRLLESRDRRDATRFGLVWEANEIERDKALNADFVALDLISELCCPSALFPSPGTPGESRGGGLVAAPKDPHPNPPPEYQEREPDTRVLAAEGRGGGRAWKNLIIEGDNFDALRYLRMTFAGRVKCIYIDPPYNTGNKDFVYNDRFVDKEDLWRHSKWCEFMFQRLTLAKDLLRQDGVIFVSIDDNEFANLRLLMDRIFGAGNFVANCIWQKRYSASNDHKTIAPLHDYVLVFQAHGNWQRNFLPRGEEKNRAYRFTDERGNFRIDNYTCNKSAEERPNLYYPITQPNTGEVLWPKKTSVWRYSQESHAKNIQTELVYWGKDGRGRVPAYKRYKHMLRNDGVVPTTWWPHTEVGHNDSAKKEIMAAIPEASRSFSTPKPVALIERVLRLATAPNDLILDFFAGSGTTAHAVHKLNKEDGGTRRVILVSSTEATVDEPDKNLCRDVCATRVRRVIEGYGTGDTQVPGLGGDFAYLRCRRIPVGQLTDIDHPQVWTALQLTHCPTLTPLVEGEPFAVADSEDQRLIYIPHFRAKDGRALVKAVRDSTAAIVYTWQPDLIKQKLRNAENVQVEAVPESLARRFGIRI